MNPPFQIGTDYYPEHWPRERWAVDARLMREFGIQAIRVAEFAWNRLEPRAGVFDFEWLDAAIDTFAQQGIGVIVGTPTASPPAWLIEAHPDILPVDSEGRTRGFGGRHHVCHSNAHYKRHSQQIAAALADHYGRDARVIGWQIDNEIGNSQEDLCHCGSCRGAFQGWLKTKFGTVNKLNEAWGTVFWSQTYDSFEQISTPRITPNIANPSLMLDWKRFRSDLVVEFHDDQVRVIRERVLKQFVTHNFMGFFDLLDYYNLAKQLDFISHDQYPRGFWEDTVRSPSTLAAALDLMAGLRNQSFVIMEQQAGPSGWHLVSETPRPGQLALWAAQSVAHGADSVVFFNWRTAWVGSEQYWHGILPHDGVPGRRYRELASFASEFTAIMKEVRGTLSGAEVGLLYSYDQNWAFEIQPHHPDFDYIQGVQKLYQGFWDNGVPVRFVAPDADFAGLKLLVVPFLYLELPGLEARLREFCEAGGHLVLTMRTGVKDEHNRVLTDRALPGSLADLAGIEIHDYDCLRADHVAIRRGRKEYLGSLWWDVVELKGAEVWAVGESSWHRGQPAITRAKTARGGVWYLGTLPDHDLLRVWAAEASREAGVASLGPGEADVELAVRRSESREFLFVLNHGGKSSNFRPQAGWKRAAGPETLAAFAVQVFVRETS